MKYEHYFAVCGEKINGKYEFSVAPGSGFDRIYDEEGGMPIWTDDEGWEGIEEDKDWVMAEDDEMLTELKQKLG